MVSVKLKSKGVRIDIAVKKGNINIKNLGTLLQTEGFRISPSIPNMPTMAISSSLKCLLGNDKLDIQGEDFFKLKSDLTQLRKVIRPYVEQSNSYQINLESSFILSSKLNITETLDAIYNPRAKTRLKMFIEPIGFRIIIENNKRPFILSFEGSKETNEVFCSLAFSTNSQNDFYNALTDVDQVIDEFIKKLGFFAKNEKNYRSSRAKLLKKKAEEKGGKSN